MFNDDYVSLPGYVNDYDPAKWGREERSLRNIKASRGKKHRKMVRSLIGKKRYNIKNDQ